MARGAQERRLQGRLALRPEQHDAAQDRDGGAGPAQRLRLAQAGQGQVLKGQAAGGAEAEQRPLGAEGGPQLVAMGRLLPKQEGQAGAPEARGQAQGQQQKCAGRQPGEHGGDVAADQGEGAGGQQGAWMRVGAAAAEEQPERQAEQQDGTGEAGCLGTGAGLQAERAQPAGQRQRRGQSQGVDEDAGGEAHTADCTGKLGPRATGVARLRRSVQLAVAVLHHQLVGQGPQVLREGVALGGTLARRLDEAHAAAGQFQIADEMALPQHGAQHEHVLSQAPQLRPGAVQQHAQFCQVAVGAGPAATLMHAGPEQQQADGPKGGWQHGGLLGSLSAV